MWGWIRRLSRARQAFCLMILALFLLLPKTSAAQTPSDLMGPGIAVDSAASGTSDILPANTQRSQYGTYERALVREASEEILKTMAGAQKRTIYSLEFLTGNHKGTWQKIAVDQTGASLGFKPQAGDSIIIYVQPSPNQTQPIIFLEGYDRQNSYLLIIIALVICGLLLAGRTGLKIMLAILVSILLTTKFVLPLYLAHLPTSLIIILFLLAFSGLNSLLAVGWNKQALTATLSTTISGLMAYGIFYIFASSAHLSWLSSETIFKNDPLLNPYALLLLVTLLMTAGLIYDLALIASKTIAELKQFAPSLGFKELFKAGMLVGRERIISLAPIICLIYIGLSSIIFLESSLALYPWIKFINHDSVSQAIILPLVGTIVLLLSLPICSLTAALAWTRTFRGTDPLRRATSWRKEGTPETDDQMPLPLNEPDSVTSNE
ncbi:MAG: YibE/F family protein [Patescibacteria group bacterium]|nr:YibE/F family protein [Patescibacteria group bacterium]